MKYNVIIHESIGHLCIIVEKNLIAGWKCQGGISTYIDRLGNIKHCQAIVYEGT
jgi:hypothetical protein